MKFQPKSITQSLRKGFANNWLVGGLIALLVATLTVSIGRNVALLELAENYLYDVRLAMVSPPRPQSSRIAVVVINDDTLIKLHCERASRNELNTTVVIRGK